MHLTLGHSPDPDDAFMFWALAQGRVETGGYTFEHILQDIQTLNERATRGELHITAISIHAYAYVLDKYALLPSGSSMGDGYGPMVVTREADGVTLEQLASRRIAVPGTMTTAYLALRLMLGRDFDHEVVPFDQILHRVEGGEFDAGLIIHEGQLTYRNQGCRLLVDLGKWWQEDTGLPLPLGGNAIRKDLGPARMSELNRILIDSIRCGLENREEALGHALGYARDMDTDLADRFVGMYVNEWTLDYGERGRRAIEALLRRGAEADLIPPVQELEFVA
jgi:1,4-dihydroxy-6-naphthoate synthase